MIRIIVGPPCAGKSSYIDANAAAGDIVVEYDRLAAAVSPNGQPTETSGKFAAYLRVMAANWTAERAQADGDEAPTVWLSATRPKNLGLLDALITAGAKIVLLDPGEDVCLERCEADGRGEEIAQVIREWYEDPPLIPELWQATKGRHMRAKNFDIKVKATGGEKSAANPFGGELAEGDFIAYASTFNDEPDSYGDVVFPGAFTKTLDTWREKGAFDNEGTGERLPLLFGHRMDDPAFNIGHIVEAKEDEHGLLVWGRIDLDTEKGQAAHRLVKSRRLNQLSFAYDIIEADQHKKDAGLDLKELDLFEVSLVQLGANRNTSVLAVKAAAETVKSTKGDFTANEIDELRDARENLREALEHIEFLLQASDPTPNPEPEHARDSDREPGNGEGPDEEVQAASRQPASTPVDAKADAAAALLNLTLQITKTQTALAAN